MQLPGVGVRRYVPHTSCESALHREPVPLYSESLDIGLLWSAKAACTFAIKWFFFQEGVLAEAEAYAPWPHQYRHQVYCERPGYARSVERIPKLGPRAVKFVRSPFDRAVGGYLSYCIQAARQTSPRYVLTAKSISRHLRGKDYVSAPREVNPQHARMLRAIGRHVGREIGNGNLFSFREYVGFLGTLDLGGGDIHVRRQCHPCEREGALAELSVIHVEQAEEALPRLEDDLGLRRSDLASLQRSRHHSRRFDDAEFVGDKPFGDTLGAPVPASRWFYDEALLDAVRRLYADDVEAYGYESP